MKPEIIRLSTPADLTEVSYRWAVEQLGDQDWPITLIVPLRLWDLAMRLAMREKPTPIVACLPNAMIKSSHDWCVSNGWKVVWSGVTL